MTIESALFGVSDGGMACFTGGGGKTTLMLRLAGYLTRSSTVIVTATTRMAVSEIEPEHVLLTKNFPPVFSRELLSEVKKRLGIHKIVFMFKDASNDKYLGLSAEEVSSLREMKLAPYMLVEADGSARMPLKGYAEHEPPLPARFDCQAVVVGADALARPMNELTTARFEILRRFLGVKENDILTPPLLLRLLTSPGMYLKNSPPSVRRVLCVNKTDLLTREALDAWVDYLRSSLRQYHGILTTGRDEEIFYGLDG